MSDRPSGAMHRWMNEWINPSVFDFWAQHINSAWSWNRPLATVVARHQEARDTVTLTLKLNRHGQLPQAGQHISVSAQINGRRVTRSYSPTRIQEQSRLVDITVRQKAGGVMSAHLCKRAQVGDVVETGAPFGLMTWPSGVGGKWLLLAAGSGITPMVSLIRQARADQSPVQITLMYWAQTHADLCFVAELREWAAFNPGFRLHVVLTQEKTETGDEAHGRLNNTLLQRMVPDLHLRNVYACGPGGFVETARQLTAGRALSLASEAFSPALLAQSDEVSVPVQITLQSTGRTVTVPSGEALLPALEAQGLQVPHGCRMGICHTCVCNKVTGTTQDLQSGQREEETNAAVRLCVSRACTDLTLDL